MNKVSSVKSREQKILLQERKYHKQKVNPLKDIEKSRLRKDIKKQSKRKSIEREVNNMILDNKTEQK